MKKSLLRILSLFLSLLIFAAVPAASVQAAGLPGNQNDLNIVAYPLDRDTRSIAVYDNSSLSGTRIGWVYGTDRITILKAGGSALYVRYPAGSRQREGWIAASAVLAGNIFSTPLRIRAGGSVTAYRYETGDETIGSIDPDDLCYLLCAGLDHENGRAQLVYPLNGGGYKIGWAAFSDIAQTAWRAVGCGQTVPDGLYKIYVTGDKAYALDGDGGRNRWGGDQVHVWENLDVPQQKLYVRYLGNGQYSLCFQNNERMLDQQGGSYESSTLMGYPDNGTPAQGWFIADIGRGRYELFNAGSGLALDVYCYQTRSCGADILAYPYNGQAVWLEQLDGGSPDPGSGGNNGGLRFADYTGVDYHALTDNPRRIAALEYAQKMCTILWTAIVDFRTWCSSGGTYNTVTSTDGTESKYFLAGKTYAGVPYSMAGRTYDYAAFAEMIRSVSSSSEMEKKYYAHGKVTTARGVDCSYMVTLCLNNCGSDVKLKDSYSTTSTMLSSGLFTKKTLSTMKPGDILLTSGHVMMFVGKTSDGRYAVFESDAGDSKCSYNTYRSLSGYTPYSFIGYGD